MFLMINTLTNMIDHVPSFDIQAEIMKRLPVKSLIRFRSVSKPWKSLIDSSKFITNYHIYHKQAQHHLFVQYELGDDQKYISIIDDYTFLNQKYFLTVPRPLSLLRKALALSSVDGLLCFYGVRRDVAGQSMMVVLWNPSVRKLVGIPIPSALISLKGRTYIGFGVCPNTSDPKLVKISTIGYKAVDWEVEVYTLSARVWKSVYNIPSAIKSCDLKGGQVYVGGFIYFCAFDDSRLLCRNRYNLIVSFDLKSDEFGEVCLPDRLVHTNNLGVTKVYESLGLLEYYDDDDDDILSFGMSCGVWVMKEGVSKTFTKMFSIKTPFNWLGYTVMELRKNGDAILIDNDDLDPVLEVGEQCSVQKNGIGINGKYDSFCVKSYMETLLLLDHSNSIIH